MSNHSVAHVRPSTSPSDLLAVVGGVAENLDTVVAALRGLFELEDERRSAGPRPRIPGVRPIGDSVIAVLQQAVLEQLEREANRLEAIYSAAEAAA
jgi:hypothetical protein